MSQHHSGSWVHRAGHYH